ncbi:hypothetical protein J6590_101892 [Homalodisca vitripennis]|nr:hypothetical protein J6590_101892 [Homalodisca vitripennis]
MDDPKSEDSLFADDLFSALETNESNIKYAVSSSLHRDASGTGEVSEAESFKEILCLSKDHEIGSQIEVRKEYLNVTVQGEVTEEEIEGQVERVESDAVVVVDDSINISDLFENENIEFIYDIGQTGDAECEEEHGEIFVRKSLSEIVMNNETDGHTNEGNESFHLTVQEEEVIDDQMGEDMEKSSSQEGVAENDEVDEVRLLTSFEDNKSKEDFDQDGTKKRVRNKKPDPSSWKKNITKLKRMTGQPFIGYQRNKVDDKTLIKRTNFERDGRKWVQNVIQKCVRRVVKELVIYFQMMTEKNCLMNSGY